MKRIKYLFQRILGMDYKNFFGTIKRISKKEHKLRIYVFFDIVRCGILHQAGYVDYEFYNMINLKHRERKMIMTRGRNNHYVSKLNSKDCFHYFDNKNEFNELFNKYLNRDWMYLNKDNLDDFKKFTKKHKEIIVKPNDLSCGKGVRKIDTSKENIEKLFSELNENRLFLVEEVAKQNKEMNKLHPDSVNTVRLVTVVSDYGVVSVVAGVVRMGTGHNVIDNFNGGGIAAMIDLETGKINSNAINTEGKIFENHPTTKTKINGFQIPLYDEIIKMVKEAALVVKEERLIGWDVCVGESKPCLIEANQFPAHDLYQLFFDKNNVKDIITIFEEAIRRK